MSVWILSKRSDYETQRLKDEFEIAGLRTLLVDPRSLNLLLNSANQIIGPDDEIMSLPKAVLVRTGSGTNDYAAAILRALEMYGVPVVNSISSTEAARDKVLTGQLMVKHNIPIPKTMLLTIPTNIVVIEREIGFPCVLKVVTGSYGKGVHLCQNKDEFLSLVQLIEALDPSRPLLVQEYVDFKFGTDLRVWVVGGKVVAAMKRQGPEGDFRANISNGGVGSSFMLDDEIIDISKNAVHALNLDISGVDLLFGKNGYLVCELNSSPGFLGIEKYCEVNIAKNVVDHVMWRINRNMP